MGSSWLREGQGGVEVTGGFGEGAKRCLVPFEGGRGDLQLRWLQLKFLSGPLSMYPSCLLRQALVNIIESMGVVVRSHLADSGLHRLLGSGFSITRSIPDRPACRLQRYRA